MSIKTARDGRETGDWTLPNLQVAAARGELLPTDLVWMAGWTEWKTLSSVESELGLRFQESEATSVAWTGREVQQEQPIPQVSVATEIAPATARSSSQSGCLAVFGAVCALALILKACTALSGVDDATQSPRESADSQGARAVSAAKHSPIENEVLKFAMSESVAYAAKLYRCDYPVAARSAVPTRVEFGTISKDPKAGEYGRRIPAVRAAFKMTCMQREQARKNEIFISTFAGNDSEYGVWRCVDTASVTVYASDGNTPTGAIGEHIWGGSLGERFEDRCGFVGE